jgi:hypothetical protein
VTFDHLADDEPAALELLTLCAGSVALTECEHTKPRWIRDEKELSRGEDLGGPAMFSYGRDAQKQDRWNHEPLDKLFERGREGDGRDRHRGGFDRDR